MGTRKPRSGNYTRETPGFEMETGGLVSIRLLLIRLMVDIGASSKTPTLLAWSSGRRKAAFAQALWSPLAHDRTSPSLLHPRAAISAASRRGFMHHAPTSTHPVRRGSHCGHERKGPASNTAWIADPLPAAHAIAGRLPTPAQRTHGARATRRTPPRTPPTLWHWALAY